MCRTNDFQAFQLRDRSRHRLNIKRFYLRFSHSNPNNPLPESLSLVYLPRIDGAYLLVDGAKVRPDSAAYLTLHRVVNVNPEAMAGEAVFGTGDRVCASEGVRFEVYFGEERILVGTISKDDVDDGWKLDCNCAMESQSADVAAVDVCLAVEGHASLCERVELVSKRKRKDGVRRRFDCGLEVIPELREEVGDDDGGGESDGVCCCCNCDEGESEGGDWVEVCGPDCEKMMAKDLEGVRWAVDVGIWVMCLGVGLLVSKASASRFRRSGLL